MAKGCRCNMCRLIEAVINSGPDSVIEAIKYAYNAVTVGYIASELQGYSDSRRVTVEAEKRISPVKRRPRLRLVQ
jgi:hypothetical protein